MDLYEYEVGGTSTPTNEDKSGTEGRATTAVATEQPSLNEEVQQAYTSFTRFWGGFRKQSASALATARKDFGSVVQQAQKEIGKYTAQPEATDSPTSTSGPTDSTAEGRSSVDAEAPARPSTERAHRRSSSDAARPSSPLATATSFFSYIQSTVQPTLASAPSTIQATLQRTLSDPNVQNFRESISHNLTTIQETVQTSVQSVQSNPTVQNIQSSVQNISLQGSVQALQSNVASIQQSDRVKAVEGFVMEKGGEFWKGAEEFFREAVKIVPPTEEELRARGSGAVLDGTNIWLFDDLGGHVAEEDDTATRGDVKGKAKAGEELGGIAVNRTAALLKKLRGDPELIRADPESGEGKGKETFTWFLNELEGKGGSVGGDAWKKKCDGELEMFEELRATMSTLVPNELDETTFWKRYWFRAWQIKQAEEKRKALLQATATSQKEEEIGWEDGDSDESESKKSTTTLTKATQAAKSSKLASQTSPRESEDSYDLVSTRSGNTSGTALAAKAASSKEAKDEEEEEEEEEDDDEEDDEEEEEEDEDEDEEGEEEEEEEEEEEAKPPPAPKKGGKTTKTKDDSDSDWE